MYFVCSRIVTTICKYIVVQTEEWSLYQQYKKWHFNSSVILLVKTKTFNHNIQLFITDGIGYELLQGSHMDASSDMPLLIPGHCRYLHLRTGRCLYILLT